MQVRTLGSTGLDVSVIGFGASPLGNVFGEVPSSAGDRAVASAIDQGINLFDVSPYYGQTLAEQRLGAALTGRRDAVVLATKCGRYGADEFDFSARRITQELEASLRRLRTDRVDLLQAHDIEFGELTQIVEETLPAMRRLQAEGKVGFIGVTGYWPGMLARAVEEGGADCVLSYCHANLFVDDMDRELVPAVVRSGAGLLNASPLHMGLLGARPVPAWHPAPAPVQSAAVQVRELCAAHGVDPAMLALRVCLDHPVVASTLVGISSEAEVAAACAALTWMPEPEFMDQVRALVEPVFNRVWPSGLPHNQDGVPALAEEAHRAD